MLKIKNILLSASLFVNFMLLFIWAFETGIQELPPWLKVAGRLHPMILHFPVALLLVVVLLEITNRRNRDNDHTVPFLLSVTAFSASVAALFGFLLLHSGGYESSNDLYWHKITGITTALITGLLAWLREIKRTVYYPALIAGSVLLIIAGHLGSTVTHGKNFITEPLLSDSKKIKNLDEAIVFRDIIQPIFAEKCVGCHNPNKRKGSLLLTSYDEMMKGGENGAVFFAGNPDTSALYNLLLLPASEDRHMPPEGKPQPESDEIALIRWWIATGAHNKQKFAEAKVPDSINKIIRTKYDAGSAIDQLNISFADQKTIKSLSNNDRVVTQLSLEKPFVSVFMANRKKIGEKEFSELQAIKDQVISIDLSNSNPDLKQIKELASFPHLTALHLENSSINDSSLATFTNMAYLEYLNISNTAITAKALEIAGKIKTLKKLYLYETEIPAQQVSRFQSERKDLRIGFTPDLSSDSLYRGRLTDPVITIDSNVFIHHATVEMSYRLKGVNMYYTLDGSVPDSSSAVYKSPLTITDSGNLKVIAIRSGWMSSKIQSFRFDKAKYRFAVAKLDARPDKRYEAKLDSSLIDLSRGSLDPSDGNYLGFYGNDMNANIGFNAPTTLNSVAVSVLVKHNSLILSPVKAELWISDADGKPLQKIATASAGNNRFNKETYKQQLLLKFPKQKIQYLRLKLTNPAETPSTHETKKAKSWIFIDEIIPDLN